VIFDTCCERSRHNNGPDANGGDDQNPKAGELLLVELGETNQWARTTFQLYFAWFALQFTVNGVAMGWLFTYHGTVSWFAPVVFVAFVAWNFIGLIGAILSYKELTSYDLLIQKLTAAATSNTSVDGVTIPRTSIPRSMMTVLFVFCAVSSFFSLTIWILVLVGGR
jgi:hypothetical protein